MIGGSPVNIIIGIHETAIGELINFGLFSKLLTEEAGSSNAYRLLDFIHDVEKGIWQELNGTAAISTYRRNLQKLYVNRLAAIIKPPSQNSLVAGRPSDVKSIAKATLVALRFGIKAVLPRYQDKMTRFHLQDIVDLINDALVIGRG